MNVKLEYPPNRKEIEAVFGPLKNAVFTYGDTIYNPSDGIIREHLHVHEQVHQRQQGSDPAKWWKRYLSASEFRIEQEAEAYRAQYQWAVLNVKDRNALTRFLHQLSSDFASSMYGSCISYQEAKRVIAG